MSESSSYKVGLVTRAYVDPGRRSWLSDGPRPLRTEIWYPAVESAREEEVLIGSPEAPLFLAGRAARKAEPLGGPFPLVLLSHGSGGSALQLGWLATRLARGGYVVAGVNHHANNALEPMENHGYLLWWERALDLSVLIDLLLADASIGRLIDPVRIGASGFSLGGHTVVLLGGGIFDLHALSVARRDPIGELVADLPPDYPDPAGIAALARELLRNDRSHRRSYRDARVRCIFPIAPALAPGFTAEGLKEVVVPTEIVVGDDDPITPAGPYAAHFAEGISGARLSVIDGGVGHFTFLGEATEAAKRSHPQLARDADGVERRAVHRRVGLIAREFFDRHLKRGGREEN